MGNYAIEAQELRKTYRLGERGRSTLSEAISRRMRRISEPGARLVALDDVTFRVSQGEAVGVLGHNGAGKSTLLKVLSRITRPTAGRVQVTGRLGSLLEVGAGFHPDLTGRENVYMNAAIIGMRRREVAAKFDAIVEFAEIEKFLDTPVRRYSSGMYVRLAFAVAAHFEPDILLIDEVLAVGDTAFQRKCMAKMAGARFQGQTLLFVSHNLATLRDITDRAILLDRGRIAAEGPTPDVIDAYLKGLRDSTPDSGLVDAARPDPSLSRAIELVAVESRTGSAGVLTEGDQLKLMVSVRSHVAPRLFRVSTIISNAGLQPVGIAFSPDVLCPPAGATGHYLVSLPAVSLAPGTYSITLALTEGDARVGAADLDIVTGALTFEAATGPSSTGVGSASWTPSWGAVNLGLSEVQLLQVAPDPSPE